MSGEALSAASVQITAVLHVLYTQILKHLQVFRRLALTACKVLMPILHMYI